MSGVAVRFAGWRSTAKRQSGLQRKRTAWQAIKNENMFKQIILPQMDFSGNMFSELTAKTVVEMLSRRGQGCVGVPHPLRRRRFKQVLEETPGQRVDQIAIRLATYRTTARNLPDGGFHGYVRLTQSDEGNYRAFFQAPVMRGLLFFYSKVAPDLDARCMSIVVAADDAESAELLACRGCPPVNRLAASATGI